MTVVPHALAGSPCRPASGGYPTDRISTCLFFPRFLCGPISAGYPDHSFAICITLLRFLCGPISEGYPYVPVSVEYSCRLYPHLLLVATRPVSTPTSAYMPFSSSPIPPTSPISAGWCMTHVFQTRHRVYARSSFNMGLGQAGWTLLCFTC